jgi:hypothetical protein
MIHYRLGVALRSFRSSTGCLQLAKTTRILSGVDSIISPELERGVE